MFGVTEEDFYLMMLGTATNACQRLGIGIPDTARNFDRVMDVLRAENTRVAEAVDCFLNAWTQWCHYARKVDKEGSHGWPATVKALMPLIEKRDATRRDLLATIQNEAPQG